MDIYTFLSLDDEPPEEIPEPIVKEPEKKNCIIQ